MRLNDGLIACVNENLKVLEIIVVNKVEAGRASMQGMSALKAAVTHVNRPLPASYVPRVIPSLKDLPRNGRGEVIFGFIPIFRTFLLSWSGSTRVRAFAS